MELSFLDHCDNYSVTILIIVFHYVGFIKKIRADDIIVVDMSWYGVIVVNKVTFLYFHDFIILQR